MGYNRLSWSPLRRFAASRLVRSHRRKCNEGNTCVGLQFKHCNGVGRLTMGTYTPRSHRRKCHECNEGNTCVQRGAEELLYAGRLTIVTHDARFAHVPHLTYKRRGGGNIGNMHAAKTRSGEAAVQKCTAETKVEKIKFFAVIKLNLINMASRLNSTTWSILLIEGLHQTL